VAQWVGCYQCDNTIKTNGVLGVDAAMPELRFQTGLEVSGAGAHLIGDVAALAFDSGYYECELKASIQPNGAATLDSPSDAGWACPVYSQYGFVEAEYRGGTFVLDGGIITATMDVSLREVGGSGTVDAGLGTQTSACATLNTTKCPWQ
jgi:hypothetical protein